MRDDGARYIPERQSAVYALDTRTLLSPGGCWREIGAQDCIIDIGSGDSFTDIYGLKRFLYLWLTKMFAIARRRPLLLAPQTSGPFTTLATRVLARMPLRGARLVFARDRLSRRSGGGLGAPGRDETVGRCRLRAALRRPERRSRRPRLPSGRQCIRDYLFEEAESGRNRFGLSLDYAHFTRRLLAELAARPNLRVHLINHVASPAPGRDDDAPVSERLRAEFPQVVCAPRFASPSEAKSYISGLDFLVAGRMASACIAAYSVRNAGRPNCLQPQVRRPVRDAGLESLDRAASGLVASRWRAGFLSWSVALADERSFARTSPPACSRWALFSMNTDAASSRCCPRPRVFDRRALANPQACVERRAVRRLRPLCLCLRRRDRDDMVAPGLQTACPEQAL